MRRRLSVMAERGERSSESLTKKDQKQSVRRLGYCPVCRQVVYLENGKVPKHNLPDSMVGRKPGSRRCGGSGKAAKGK